MAGSWNDIQPEDVRSILIGLIGSSFGEHPEERISEIRESRKAYADQAAKLVNLNNTDTVMDLGSGCGFGTYWLADIAKKVIACDISDAYLEFAKKQCTNKNNVQFNKIENTNLGFIPDHSVDKIISMSVFIHMNIYDIYYYFKEFARILKPHGLVCFDIADGDLLDFGAIGDREKHFLETASIYARKESHLSGLMNWNSEKSIVNIANKFGFERKRRLSDILLFEKTRRAS